MSLLCGLLNPGYPLRQCFKSLPLRPLLDPDVVDAALDVFHIRVQPGILAGFSNRVLANGSGAAKPTQENPTSRCS